METTRFILIGGGQHARVVVDSLLSQGADVLALFDPQYDGQLFGVPQRGEYDPTFESTAVCIIAIGDNLNRKRLSTRILHQYSNTVHPSVVFSPFASIGTGCMILQGAIIQAQTRIGNHVIVNTGAQIDHDCVISDFAHVAPGVVLCGSVTVGEGALVGAGATISPGRKIGAWATVGAGAVVIKDVPDYAIVVGNPARIIKYNKA